MSTITQRIYAPCMIFRMNNGIGNAFNIANHRLRNGEAKVLWEIRANFLFYSEDHRLQMINNYCDHSFMWLLHTSTVTIVPYRFYLFGPIAYLTTLWPDRIIQRRMTGRLENKWICTWVKRSWLDFRYEPRIFLERLGNTIENISKDSRTPGHKNKKWILYRTARCSHTDTANFKVLLTRQASICTPRTSYGSISSSYCSSDSFFNDIVSTTLVFQNRTK